MMFYLIYSKISKNDKIQKTLKKLFHEVTIAGKIKKSKKDSFRGVLWKTELDMSLISQGTSFAGRVHLLAHNLSIFSHLFSLLLQFYVNIYYTGTACYLLLFEVSSNWLSVLGSCLQSLTLFSLILAHIVDWIVLVLLA